MNRLPILTALLLVAAPLRAEEVGLCRFDTERLSFAGSPAEQAECLLQKISRGGVLAPQPLPAALRAVLESGGAPSPAELEAALAAFPEPYAAYARLLAPYPASQTEAGLTLAYFAIHDTSMPFLGREAFPRDPDRDPRVNDLWVYAVDEPVAHVFINRVGQIWAGHDLSTGWRATKLESWIVGKPARGRFVHIELVQPRRYAPGSDSLGDTLAPVPGFSDAQYRQLAALYVYASARAGRWLIPAFHATMDGGLPDGHDDPQNFELEKFAAELARLRLPRKPD